MVVPPPAAASASVSSDDVTLTIKRSQLYSVLLLGFVFFVHAALVGEPSPHGTSLRGGGAEAPGAAASAAAAAGSARGLSCATPPFLDFLEIGTSDFRNLLLEVVEDQNAGIPKKLLRKGVSVDVMSIYLDAMPTLPADVHRKLNVAIVGHEPHAAALDVFYIRPEDLAPNGLPDYLRGCNRVGEPHPLQLWELGVAKKEDLLRTATVPVMSVQTLLQRTGACRVGMFKVDVEGLDGSVLLAYVDYLWAHHECWADYVTFEKKMIDGEAADATKRLRGFLKLDAGVAALSSVGYHTHSIMNLGGDTDETTFVYDAAFDARNWAAHGMLPRIRNKVSGREEASTSLDQAQSEELLGAGHINSKEFTLWFHEYRVSSNYTPPPVQVFDLTNFAQQRFASKDLMPCVKFPKAGDPSPFAPAE
jgi:hypothetical protein